tara:strand:+ start:334 stop:555 length:222 start_codon:yes stop_codon:yes gene_type:complete
MNNRQKRNNKERARSKAWSRVTMLSYEIDSNRRDLKQGTYGGVTEAEMVMIMEGNKVEQQVWNYILELIEKDE